MSASFLAHGTLRNRSWRNCERHRTWMTPRKLCFPDIRVWCRYGLKKCSNMHRASTGLCEIQSRFWLMWTQILSVAQKLTTIDKHLQKKFSFSNKVTVLCKEHWRADVANTKKKKMNPLVFLEVLLMMLVFYLYIMMPCFGLVFMMFQGIHNEDVCLKITKLNIWRTNNCT